VDNKREYYRYNCKQCGMCCRYLHLIDEMKAYDRGDGVCRYLDDYNKCKIYNNRPSLCNGKYVYEKFYPHMSVEEYHNLLDEYCKVIRSGEFERLHKNI